MGLLRVRARGATGALRVWGAILDLEKGGVLEDRVRGVSGEFLPEFDGSRLSLRHVRMMPCLLSGAESWIPGSAVEDKGGWFARASLSGMRGAVLVDEFPV